MKILIALITLASSLSFAAEKCGDLREIVLHSHSKGMYWVDYHVESGGVIWTVEERGREAVRMAERRYKEKATYVDIDERGGLRTYTMPYDTKFCASGILKTLQVAKKGKETCGKLLMMNDYHWDIHESRFFIQQGSNEKLVEILHEGSREDIEANFEKFAPLASEINEDRKAVGSIDLYFDSKPDVCFKTTVHKMTADWIGIHWPY